MNNKILVLAVLLVVFSQNSNTKSAFNNLSNQSDSLPESFTDEKMKDLRDANGKKIFPADEGDAFQQRTFTGSIIMQQHL